MEFTQTTAELPKRREFRCPIFKLFAESNRPRTYGASAGATADESAEVQQANGNSLVGAKYRVWLKAFLWKRE
jgi:hypothetical protein